MITPLSDEVILEIVRLAKTREYSKKQIAEKLNVNRDIVAKYLKILGVECNPFSNAEKLMARLGITEREQKLVSTPTSTQTLPSGNTVLVIPDTHHPFEHPDALAFLVAVRTAYNTNMVIHMGDEVDWHSVSRWPTNPDGLSAGAELSKARERLVPWFKEFPNVKVCTSNHTVRPFKKMFESGLPAALMPTYSTMLQAPDGWEWADFWEVDGVRYIHGEGKSGFNAHIMFMRGYKQSVVIGHIHSYAAVSYEGNLFAVNSGCLIDPKAYAFAYAKHMPIHVNLGCSVVFGGKSAKFIPMHLDSNNRWTGEL